MSNSAGRGWPLPTWWTGNLRGFHTKRLNDQPGGKDIVYDLSEKTQSAPVKMAGGRIAFKPPFDPPALVFEGNKMTATLEKEFVDVWEKVP